MAMTHGFCGMYRALEREVERERERAGRASGSGEGRREWARRTGEEGARGGAPWCKRWGWGRVGKGEREADIVQDSKGSKMTCVGSKNRRGGRGPVDLALVVDLLYNFDLGLSISEPSGFCNATLENESDAAHRMWVYMNKDLLSRRCIFGFLDPLLRVLSPASSALQ